MAPKPPSRIIAAIGLVAAAGIGVWGSLVAASRNGLFDAITNTVGSGAKLQRYIPGAPTPLRTAFTGFPALDDHILTLVCFFSSFMDGEKSVGSSVTSWYLMIQFCLAWMLLVMEGLRRGNSRSISSWTGTMGLIFQNVTYTLAVPIYLVIHLFSSPVARPEPGRDAITVDIVDLNLIPLCTSLAFVLPAILMALPSPSILSPSTHYCWHAVWQAFPLWQSILQRVLRNMIPDAHTSPNSPAKTRLAARRFYTGIIGISTIAHIAILAIASTPGHVIPSLWPDVVRDAFVETSFLSVFAPAPPWSPPIVDATVVPISPDAMPPLVLWFLQWDLYSGTTAMLLWAVYLCRAAEPESSLGDVAGKALLWTAVCGPVGAVAVMLRGRDEIVLGRLDVNKRE